MSAEFAEAVEMASVRKPTSNQSVDWHMKPFHIRTSLKGGLL
jgi:hypothetical protein